MKLESVNTLHATANDVSSSAAAEWRVEFNFAGPSFSRGEHIGANTGANGAALAGARLDPLHDAHGALNADARDELCGGALPCSGGADSTNAPRERAVRLRGAELELERLHLEELARLLGQAAELRWTSGASGAHDPAAAARWSGELAAWRTALADELRAARLDGARHSRALEELLRALGLDVAHWPTPRHLARVAASLHPSARRRAALARVAQREGDFACARAEYRAALACGPAPRLRRELERELAALDSGRLAAGSRASRTLERAALRGSAQS